MSEPIPDDIRKTVDALCDQWLEMRGAGHDHDEVVELIGRAILAERRRWTPCNPKDPASAFYEVLTSAKVMVVSFPKSGGDER